MLLASHRATGMKDYIPVLFHAAMWGRCREAKGLLQIQAGNFPPCVPSSRLKTLSNEWPALIEKGIAGAQDM